MPRLITAARIASCREQRATRKLAQQIAELVDVDPESIIISIDERDAGENPSLGYDDAVEVYALQLHVCIQLPPEVITTAADHLAAFRELIEKATIRALWREYVMSEHHHLDDDLYREELADAERYLSLQIGTDPVIIIALASSELSLRELWDD